MKVGPVVADGKVLDRIIDQRYECGDCGLEHHAFRRWQRAQTLTPWGRSCIRQVALLDGPRLLASATTYALSGVLDQRATRVCGIGSVLNHSGDGDREPARVLVEQLVEEAAASGAEVALLFSTLDEEWCQRTGFHSITPAKIDLTLTTTPRPGAPMVLVRGGEDRDLGAIAAMGRVRSGPYRFHLERDSDFIHHAISSRRLLAGFGASGARELHFFIAEEGITAAAYAVVSVVGRAWTIQECGDRDPSGARIGAILQALAAREPASDSPSISGWLPRGFCPPQTTLASGVDAGVRVQAMLLDGRQSDPPLTADDSLYWRSDLF